MIPVIPAPEPPSFDVNVRRPGLAAIEELLGNAPAKQRPGPRRAKVAEEASRIPASKLPPYWRRAIPDMLVAYERRCAYLAMYFEPATSQPTIDHAIPKSYAWDKVYEWSNYRLCAAIVNAMKGELLTLVDPFQIRSGWFELNLKTLRVERGARAPKTSWRKIDATLPLLNDAACVDQRTEYVAQYLSGGINLQFLERRAPFIALELRRQGQLVRGDV